MAQEEFEQLTQEWTDFGDIVTVDDGTTYYIQNRGSDTLVALESASTPDADNQEGVMILPYQFAVYEKGSENLYLRAFNKSCAVNISKVG